MDNGDGDGNGGVIGATGMTRYLTIEQFKQYRERNEAEHKKVDNALWGSEGTEGIIADIHDVKLWIKLIGASIVILVGIVSPIITTLLLKYIGVVN